MLLGRQAVLRLRPGQRADLPAERGRDHGADGRAADARRHLQALAGGVGGVKPTVFYGAPTGFAGMLASPKLPARERGGAAPGVVGRRGAAGRARRALQARTSAWTSSTASAPPRCCTSSCPTGPASVRYGTTGWPVPGYDDRAARRRRRARCPTARPATCTSTARARRMMYWGNREKTRETFQGGWTKSGDKYVRNADGSYTYGGRSDDMLKVSGIYVSPFEVEATLVQHPAVLEAAVIGVADAEGLTKTKAFVVLKAGAAADRGRAEGLREGPAGALQVPAPDRVRRRPAEDGHRQDPALQAARTRKPRREHDASSSSSIDWRGAPRAHRARMDRRRARGRAAAGVPARGPGLAVDVARLSAAAVRRRRLPRPGVFAPRLRPLHAARGRRSLGPGLHAPPGPRGAAGAAAGAATSTQRAALAVRPQRRRLDRAAACRAVPATPWPALVVLAPHILVEDLSVAQHRQGARGLRQHRPARSAWRATTTTPTRPSGAGTTSGCTRPSATGTSRPSSPPSAARCWRCRALDDEYGTLEQIRGIARRVPHDAAAASCPTAAIRRTATSRIRWSRPAPASSRQPRRPDQDCAISSKPP